MTLALTMPSMRVFHGLDCAGPPANASQVLAMFDHVRQQWPGATVQASTLDAYLEGLTQALAAGGLTLPVVTGVLRCMCLAVLGVGSRVHKPGISKSGTCAKTTCA
jgi:hypothetical protein